jgi:hypothetical protein
VEKLVSKVLNNYVLSLHLEFKENDKESTSIDDVESDDDEYIEISIMPLINAIRDRIRKIYDAYIRRTTRKKD